MKNWMIIGILSLACIMGKDRWYSKNLKGIEELHLEFNLIGLDDSVWENRVVSFIELRFLEYDLRMVENVSAKVKKIVADHLAVEEAKVTDEASFIDDLGADSLDTVELVMAFEEEFGSEISDSDAEKILTVGDAIKFIESKAS